MVGQGVSRSDSEIAQKSCVSGRTDQNGAGVQRRAPGTISTSMRVGRPPGLEQDLEEGGAGHAVDADVARQRSAHAATLAGARKRLDSAVELLGHRLCG